MQAYKNIQIDSLCNNIIELNNGKYALSKENSIIFINKETETIENNIPIIEKTINRIIQLKNNNIATCSDDRFIKIYSIDNFQLISNHVHELKYQNIQSL